MPARAAQEIVSSCIASCEAAAAACEQCASWALQERGRNLHRCVLLTLDCGELCRLTAGLVLRGSEVAQSLCRVCAEICDLCASEAWRHDLFHTNIAAERCHRAALACRRMMRPTLESENEERIEPEPVTLGVPQRH